MENEENSVTATSNIPEICIDPADFDRSRLVLHEPKTMSFTMGQTEVKMTTSDARYLDEEGRECLLYIAAPPQQCFGVSYTYPMEIKEADQSPDNAKGFQVAYPVTSLQTVDSPLESEQAYIDLVEQLWEAAVEQGREEAEKDDDCLIPSSSVNSFIAAAKKGKWEMAVKRPCEYPKTKDKKSLDTTKPMRQYVKLISTGKDKTLKAKTPFYGPGEKKYNAVKFISKRGIIEPCFWFEGIYYGSHGPTASHGASLRFKVAEANYTEVSGATGVPSKKLLRRNTNKPTGEEDDGSQEGPDEGAEEGTFGAPGSNDAVATPKKATVKKTTAKAPVAKAPIVKKGAAKPKVAPKATTKAVKKAPVKPKVAPKKAPKKVESEEEDAGDDVEEEEEE